MLEAKENKNRLLVRRAIAYMIDISLLFLIFGYAVYRVTVCGVLCYNPLDGVTSTIHDYFVLIMIMIYLGVTEAIFSKTLGKKILGLKVISNSDKKPKLKVIFIRTLVRALMIIDLIPILFGRHETLHERLSKTMVIKS